MTDITHRTVEANGIRIHVAEAGEGPLVLLCHGFPESWYSWRHQMKALAEAGFRAVAPDMRGYGRTDRPEAIETYTLLHLVGDMVALVSRARRGDAVIVGHDWGAPVAWSAALLRPDVFRAVAGLSVPSSGEDSGLTTAMMPRTESSQFYMLYFRSRASPRPSSNAIRARSVRTLLFAVGRRAARQSDGSPDDGAPAWFRAAAGFLSRRPLRSGCPPWLTEADVDFYAGEFSRTGFRGGLNWYRNIDRDWALMAPFDGLKVTVPALYVAGDRDLVVAFAGRPAIQSMPNFVPQLRDTIMLPGCGHWTQQERPEEVNAALIGFLRGLP